MKDQKLVDLRNSTVADKFGELLKVGVELHDGFVLNSLPKRSEFSKDGFEEPLEELLNFLGLDHPVPSGYLVLLEQLQSEHGEIDAG